MATASPRTDAPLIRRLRERDRAAWEDLYAEYGPRLHGFAYRLAGNEHDAADLVQETFVRALPRLDQLDPETTQLGPYLFTTLRNLFLKSVERGKRVHPVDEVPEPVRVPAPIEDDPERSTLLSYQQQEVRAANALLSQRQRLVLALRELEERSYAEIGELVGLNENAVAQLVFRARESLRTELRLAQVDPERLPEPCRTYLPQLAAHLDGQLRGARRDEVLTHLEGCETCQATLESMEEAKRRYRTILLPLGAGEGVARATDHELERRGYWSQPPRSGGRSRRVRRAALLGVGVLALGAGGLGTAALLDRDEPAAVAPVPVSAVQPAAPPPPAPTPSSPSVGVTVTLEQLTGPAVAPATTSPATTSAAGSTSVTVSVPPPSTVPTSPAAKPPAARKPKVAQPPPRPKPKPKPATTAPATTSPAPSPPVTTAEPPTTAPPVAPADTTPPTVTFTATPPATAAAANATFAFTASESSSSFACALDGAAFAACTSPTVVTGLAARAHTFAVRATDGAGNTGPAAQHAWTVQGFTIALPDLLIATLTRNSVVVRNVGTAPAAASTLTITLIGTFPIEALAPGQSATRAWSVCRAGTLTARADRTDAVTESNESNNVASLVSTCP